MRRAELKSLSYLTTTEAALAQRVNQAGAGAMIYGSSVCIHECGDKMIFSAERAGGPDDLGGWAL